MELDLTPKFSQKIIEGEGGEYHNWSSSDFPLLSESKVGAGRLVLNPRGFALPHYADSDKVGFVLQGCDGVVGMVLPNESKEIILELKKGDLIPVPLGAISWWFNNGDSELVIVFLGETTKAHLPGNITYFFLTGALSVLGGFSPDFVKKSFDMNNDEANKLVKSQSGVLIVKLEESKILPKPHQNSDNTKDLVYNMDSTLPHFSVKGGGFWNKVTKSQFPFLGQVGLSANHIRLEANSMSSPVYTCDSAVHVIYIINGGGQIQVVGFNGKRMLDTEVKAGHLVVVPRFFVVSKIAGDEGMECFSIITSPEPVLQDLAGKESVFKALSSEVLQASLNVTADFEEQFISNMRSTVIFPPRNNGDI